MLRVAARANHQYLSHLYIQELRGHGFVGPVYPSVVGPGAPQMRHMIERANGAHHQMMAFHNPRGHQTEKPPRRQRKAWARIHQVWRHKGEDHLKWHQHALYHQTWEGKTPEEWACASIDAGLKYADGEHEANVALWSFHWLRQPWARRVVQRYAPKPHEDDMATGPQQNLQLTHADVIALQSVLFACDFYPARIDGHFGEVTVQALEDFQEAVGHLEVTGRIDVDTWSAIEAAGRSILDAWEEDDGDPETWDALPGSMVADVMRLAEACVEHGVVYGPGRGMVDVLRGLWIVTQGPFGLDSARYKTKRRGPAMVCSSWTYFVLMYILRRWDEFEDNKAGAQPPLHVVATSPEETHRWKKSGPWLGLSPYLKRVAVDGSTRSRHRRAKKGFADLLEWWERFEADPLSLPELSVWEWASARKGFVHHTALVVVERSDKLIHFIDAGGYKDRAGTFSGSLMNIETISTRGEAIAKSKQGWGRAFGIHNSTELHLALARPMPGLGFEVEPGEVTVAWEGDA